MTQLPWPGQWPALLRQTAVAESMSPEPSVDVNHQDIDGAPQTEVSILVCAASASSGLQGGKRTSMNSLRSSLDLSVSSWASIFSSLCGRTRQKQSRLGNSDLMDSRICSVAACCERDHWQRAGSERLYCQWSPRLLHKAARTSTESLHSSI